MSASEAQPAARHADSPPQLPSQSEFTVVIRRVTGTVMVRVRGTLDASTAAPLEGLLRDLVDNQGNRSVAIDLRAASRPHPAVSDVLMAIAVSAERRGSSFCLLKPSRRPTPRR